MSTTTITLRISGMHCASCGMLIDETIHDLPGISESRTDVRLGTTTVTYDPGQATPEQIQDAIVEAGYQVGDEDREAAQPSREGRLFNIRRR